MRTWEWWARCCILSRWGGRQSEIFCTPGIWYKSVIIIVDIFLLATYATALRIVFAWYVFIHISKCLAVRDGKSVIITFVRVLSPPKVLCLSVSRAFLSLNALGMAFRQRLKNFSLIRFELNCTAGNDYNSDVRQVTQSFNIKRITHRRLGQPELKNARNHIPLIL